MDLRQLESTLKSEAALLAELSPDGIRRLCDNRSKAGRLIAEAFESLIFQATSDGPSKPREGFVSHLSELEWLTKLMNIARMCERFKPFPFDEDEMGYADEAKRLQGIRDKQASLKRATTAKATMAMPMCSTDIIGSDEQYSIQYGSPIAIPEDAALAKTLVPALTVPMLGQQELQASCPEVSQSSDRRRTPVRLTPVHTGSMVISNLLTRCAIGTIGRRGVAGSERPRYRPEEPLSLTRVSGYRPSELVVSYSGQELAVGDLETWSALLKLASPANLGGRVQFWSRDILALLHRGQGGSAYRLVREEIHRLQGGVVTMRTTLPSVKQLFKEMFPDDPVVNDRRFASNSHPIEVSFSLLGPASTNGSRWSIVIPREVALAFSDQMRTWFKRETYFSMGSDAARRLFLFYASHPAPWPFTLHELGEYVGSGMTRTFDLQRQMIKAHKEMQKAGFIKSWRYGSSERRVQSEPVFEVNFARRDDVAEQMGG